MEKEEIKHVLIEREICYRYENHILTFVLKKNSKREEFCFLKKKNHIFFFYFQVFRDKEKKMYSSLTCCEREMSFHTERKHVLTEREFLFFFILIVIVFEQFSNSHKLFSIFSFIRLLTWTSKPYSNS